MAKALPDWMEDEPSTTPKLPAWMEDEPAQERIREMRAEANPGPGVLDTAKDQFLAGVFPDWTDEMAGAYRQAGVGLRAKAQGVDLPPEELAREGKDARDAARLSLGEQRSARPGLSTVANIGGALARDFLVSRTGIPVGSPLYQTAVGALQGAGQANEAKDMPLGAAKGAGLSLAASGVGNLVGRAMQSKPGRAVASGLNEKVRSYLRDFAAERAVKATGAIQNNIKGIPREELLSTGRALLGTGIVKPLRGPEGVNEASKELTEQMGPLIGDLLDKADQQVAESGKGAFDWDPVLYRIQEEVASKLGPTGRRILETNNVVKDVVEAAKGGGYAAANHVKSEIGGSYRPGAEPLVQKLQNQVYGILNDEIEKQMSAHAGTQVGQEFLDAKRLFRVGKTAEKWSAKGMEREAGNRLVSPSDYISGAAALASGGSIPTVMALGAGHRAVRKYGSSVAAGVANSVSKSNWVKSLLSQSPDRLGRFAGPLASAARSGDKQLDAAIYVMAERDPEFRDLLKSTPEDSP